MGFARASQVSAREGGRKFWITLYLARENLMSIKVLLRVRENPFFGSGIRENEKYRSGIRENGKYRSGIRKNDFVRDSDKTKYRSGIRENQIFVRDS